jgi:hypothetical protein
MSFDDFTLTEDPGAPETEATTDKGAGSDAAAPKGAVSRFTPERPLWSYPSCLR